jgi:hypothetical protein
MANVFAQFDEESKPVNVFSQFSEVEKVDEPLVKQIDDALLKIPGASTVAEFAAGANRSIMGFLDFIGPDNINAILETAGSDVKVPRLSNELAAPQGTFNDGLSGEIAGKAGELASMAVGGGAALRGAASQLSPLAAAGESAGLGLLRQMGMAKPAADAAGGAASGVGSVVGREVGGAEGEAIGGILAPVAISIPLSSAKSAASNLLKKAAPSSDELKSVAGGIYKSLDESGVTIPVRNYNFLADDISATLKKEGLDKDLTPKAMAVTNRFQLDKGKEKTLSEIDTLRKVAQGAASSLDKAEQRLGVIAVKKIDDFLDDIPDEVISGKGAGAAYRSARDLWQRARKSEDMGTLLLNADNQASGVENGIRTQFRSLLKKIDSGKARGYTKQEREAVKKVVTGTKPGNIARFMGKFGIMDGITSRTLTTMGGAGLAGAATGSGTVALAVPLIGQVSGALAQRMTENNAAMAQAIIRAGKSGIRIAELYVKNTPKQERSITELAELLLKNKVPLASINTAKASPLLSDAAVIAAAAQINDNKESAE